MEKRAGTKFIPFMDSDIDMVIVSMLEFDGNMYVATQKGVYILREEILERVVMKDLKEVKE